MQPGGARTTCDDAHIELDLTGGPYLGRRVGNGEGPAAFDSRNHQLHILSSLEVHGLVEREVDRLDGGRERLHARHRGVEVAHGDRLCIRVFVDVGLYAGVALQRGAAGQGLASVALKVHQRERVGMPMVHLTLADLYLAATAQTMAAGVGNVDALSQGGIQQGLPLFHLDGGA